MLRIPDARWSHISVAATAAACLTPTQALAHVKWFCAFDIAGQPRGLENVLCLDFELLLAAALIMVLAGCLVEATSAGPAMLRALDRITERPRMDTEIIIRAIAGFFFVSLWAYGGMMLTPELKTESAVFPFVQLGIAACLIWRATLPLAALGIFYLFVQSVMAYGWFHLLDYPIFLGLAAYLAMTSFDRKLFNLRPLDVFRIATAITLMWASVEKWAYPEWTFPLFVIHPNMNMGFDPEFFMRAAGAIEFALAFSLLCTPLVRRIGAILLLAMFLSAIAAFGKIDAVGHAVIIAVLIAIICDDQKREVEARQFILVPVAYLALLAVFLAGYYSLHSLSFGSTLM